MAWRRETLVDVTSDYTHRDQWCSEVVHQAVSQRVVHLLEFL